ncbi:MAG TPA: hypothetical protein DEB46_11475 [Myxococcales bacterium]|nr:hypothetical protein [Myxococcales bacterium]
MRRIFILLVAITAWIGADRAEACGGLFCGNTPVDQTAERILFEVNDDNTTSAVIEIQYQGRAEDFSWVIPVPALWGVCTAGNGEVEKDRVGGVDRVRRCQIGSDDNPCSETASCQALEVVPPSVVRALDLMTNPRIIPPPTTCSDRGSRGGFLAAADSSVAEAGDESNGVEVTELPSVGPYAPILVSGSDAQELVDWLGENEYAITQEMVPLIADYVAREYQFLAMKLEPDADVSDIQPIKMTCPGSTPSIPLVLTGVAAEPEMGVKVFIMGDNRYQAGEDWSNVAIDVNMVNFNPRDGSHNYFGLVSWELDKAGGRGFITQFAGPTGQGPLSGVPPMGNIEDAEETADYIRNLFERYGYMSRMYSRVSGWEMLSDPVFISLDGGDVPRELDLSNREPIEVCGDNDFRVACGRFYCGEGARCGITRDGDEGCVCPEGTVARVISGPQGVGWNNARSTIYCANDDFDMLASMTPDANTPGNPCQAIDCGAGTCQVVGGAATCRCEDHQVAIMTDSSNRASMTCVEAFKTFEPGQLLWPVSPGSAGCGCSSTTPLETAGFLGVLAATIVLRRRRRTQRLAKRAD